MSTAASKGNMEIIKYLEDKGVKEWNAGLLGAARANNLELIKYFEEKGANDLNFGLIGAVQSNNIDMVKYFINRGANEFDRALFSAAGSANLELFKYLESLTREKGEKIYWEELAFEAAEDGNVEVLRYLIDKPGIDVGKIYKLAQEVEQGPIIDFLREKFKRRLLCCFYNIHLENEY